MKFIKKILFFVLDCGIKFFYYEIDIKNGDKIYSDVRRELLVLE